jgi:uncharacterized membrane-anchored protein
MILSTLNVYKKNLNITSKVKGMHPNLFLNILKGKGIYDIFEILNLFIVNVLDVEYVKKMKGK